MIYWFMLNGQVSYKVQYPADYSEMSKEDLKDFKQNRYGNDDFLFVSVVLSVCSTYLSSYLL